MEIDPKSEDGTVYEALNQREASRSETYMLSSVSDMSDDDFRRCSDVSRQSSSRYAEHKPLIRSSAQLTAAAAPPNLLSTISSVMGGASVRSAPGHQRTSILSTISGLRYTVDGEPLPRPAVEAPVQVTTTVEGDQFVCLNLSQADQQLQPISLATQHYQNQLDQQQQLNQQQQQQLTQQQLINFGTIQAPVHS